MKQFPVMLSHLYHLRPREREQHDDCPKSIPWELVEPHNSQALFNHGQSLERLAQRGGLSPDELVAVLEDRKWESMTIVAAIDRLKKLLKEAE